MPNPWDREDHEPPLAYAAFLIYRDMGPSRTIREAYRLSSGNVKATQASGQYNEWATRFRWIDRAKAWDHHGFELQQRATQQALVATGFKAATKRFETVKTEVTYGEKCIARGDVILNFPLAEKRVTKTVVDPISKRVYDLETHWEAMDARMVALAAKIGEIGFGIIHNALDYAEALERGEPVSRELSEAQQQKAVNKAERLWQEWEAEKKRKRAEANRPQLMPPATEADEAAS